MDVIEGATLEALENFDLAVAQAWTAECMAAGRETWDDPDEPDSWQRGWTLTDRRYVKCEFSTVKLLPPGGMYQGDVAEFAERFEDRPALRNVAFEKCRSTNRWLTAEGAVFDDVTFVDFKGELHLDLCALRHVSLVGRFPLVYINRRTALARDSGWPHKRNHVERVDGQNTCFHASTDWVLDISRAFTREIDVFDLPTEKVRVDPVRQAFVVPERLEPVLDHIEGLADDLSMAWTLTRRLRHRQARPMLIATTPRHKDEEAELALIERLTADGLVLPTATRPNPI